MSITVSDGSSIEMSTRTHPLTPDGTDRVIKKGSLQPLEVTNDAIVLSAQHFMVIQPSMLGDVRYAAYYDAKLVPEVIEDANFLGSVEILKNGENRELFCRAITAAFHDTSKLPKAQKCDVAHCWSLNDATMAKITENYEDGSYMATDLSTSDREAFDAFFALADEKKRLDLKEMDDANPPPTGFLVSKAFAQCDKSQCSAGRRVTTGSKRKLEHVELEKRLSELEKRAKWIDSFTMTKTGQVTLHLNVKNADGTQKVVVADPLE